MTRYKEYKLEMFANGVWQDAFEPNGMKCQITKISDSANRIMDITIKRWDDYKNSDRHRKYKYKKRIPTDFRIVSRDVVAHSYQLLA